MNKIKIENDIIDRIINWCEKEYGFSKFKNERIDWTLEYDKRLYLNGNVFPFEAEFDDDTNSITIYYKNIKNYFHLIEAIIHEYQHYLQFPSWYSRYQKMYSYTKNPYEIQASKVSERDYKKCYKELKING